MIEEKIEQFQSVASKILPMMLRNARVGKADVYEEYALLTYQLSREISFDEVKAMFENHHDAEICYITKPCEESCYVASLCAFSLPRRRCKYKVNALTNSRGGIDSVMITVYQSLEYMVQDLRYDLESHQDRCSIDYCLGVSKLLSIFSV